MTNCPTTPADRPTVPPELRPSVRCPHLTCTHCPTVLPGFRPSVRYPHLTCTHCPTVCQGLDRQSGIPTTPAHRAQQSCQGLDHQSSIPLHQQIDNTELNPTILPGLGPLVRCPHHTCKHTTALSLVFSFTCVEHTLFFVLTGAMPWFISALSAVALALNGFSFLI